MILVLWSVKNTYFLQYPFMQMISEKVLHNLVEIIAVTISNIAVTIFLKHLFVLIFLWIGYKMHIYDLLWLIIAQKQN